MYTITSLGTDYKQSLSWPISGYVPVNIFLEFRENQLGWFYSLTWDTFIINNDRIVVSNNLLDPFKNLIPFGIAIDGPDYVDPFSIDAWTKGWTFNILEPSEI